MPPYLALLLGFVLVFWALRQDRQRGFATPADLFWPTLWYMVVSSRPVGIWLDLWNVQLVGEGALLELIDASFYSALSVIGLRILSRRALDWNDVFARNRFLLLFILLAVASVAWSDYNWISFKRFIKLLGSVIIALAIVTSAHPFDAIRTILRRCLYIHLTMSVVCVKYFRGIGVAFDWNGTGEAWQGIATSKNTMGQVAMLGVIIFGWEALRAWRERGWRNHHLIFLGFALWLLRGSSEAVSKTSVLVTAFAIVALIALLRLRHRPAAQRTFAVAYFTGTVLLVTFILAHSIFVFGADSLLGSIVSAFGRDITLTDRLYIWQDMHRIAAGSPFLGVGYGGFWIGREANVPWNTHTWVLGQGHNGYIDIYLQLGLAGSFLFAGILFSNVGRLLAIAQQDFERFAFSFALFVTTVFVNITETTFIRGDHHLWLVFLLTVIGLPATSPVETEQLTAEGSPDDAGDLDPATPLPRT
jgi:O-antigen ligase